MINPITGVWPNPVDPSPMNITSGMFDIVGRA